MSMSGIRPSGRAGWAFVVIACVWFFLAASLASAAGPSGTKTAGKAAAKTPPAPAEPERERVTADDPDAGMPKKPAKSEPVNEPEVNVDGLWQPAGKEANIGGKPSGGLKIGAVMTRQEQGIEQITQFYMNMYDKHLQLNNWIVRAFAVISLARIQDPRITDRLMQIMASGKYVPRPRAAGTDSAAAPVKLTIPPPDAGGGPVTGERRGDVLVKVFAWEALAARYDTLTPEQQKLWRLYALAMCRKGWLAGDMRVNVVKLMECEGPTQEHLNLFSTLFANTNSMDPYDIHTLEAMRSCVATWKHAGLVKALIAAMGTLDDFYRAEYLLGDLGAGVSFGYTNKDKGSKYMQRATQEAWFKWFQENKLEQVKKEDLKKFSPAFALMPAGERITDPKDPQWRKDLELDRFQLDPIDVGFVVDSTGSMGPVVRWVQNDVMKMMRAFEMISLEPRIGVTFYRDHGDEYVTQVYPLTGTAQKLAKSIQTVNAKGGGDLPEAIYEALDDALNRMGWSKSSDIRKAIVLIGDAPPHEETLSKVHELVDQAAKLGVKFYCVKVRTPKGADELPSFDDISKWGSGKSMEGVFAGVPAANSTDIANALAKDSADQVIFSEVLKGGLAQGYHDRIEPFVGVLCQYVQMPLKEKREPFEAPKPTPPRVQGEPGGPGGHPAPPKDPREQ